MFNISGGMLTGSEIEKQIKKGNIGIDPFDPNCINPNSYNLKLHPQLLVYSRGTDRDDIIFPNKSFKYNNEQISASERFFDRVEKMTKSIYSDSYIETNIDSIVRRNPIMIMDPLDMKIPNDTIEFEIPEDGYVLQPGVLYIGRTVERTWTDKYIPMINGRSSGGRLGISIHICAGFGDVGFDGTWTLEITVVEPVRIYPYVEIAQVCYFKPEGSIKKIYRGRYYNQVDATASRFYRPKEN